VEAAKRGSSTDLQKIRKKQPQGITVALTWVNPTWPDLGYVLTSWTKRKVVKS